MRLKFYAVYDSKVGAYASPFLLRSEGEAIRSFGQAVNDRGTQFWQHPGDFTLFCVGEFDDQTGKLIPCEPFSVCQAISVKKAAPDLPLFHQTVPAAVRQPLNDGEADV